MYRVAECKVADVNKQAPMQAQQGYGCYRMTPVTVTMFVTL